MKNNNPTEWVKADQAKPKNDELVIAKVRDAVSGRTYITNSSWDGRHWNHKVFYFAGWPVVEWRRP